MKATIQNAQTRKKAIIPKIISGIIATVSIVVIGVLTLSSFWFWTSLEIMAGLLVALGCWGEWYLFKNPANENDEPASHIHHSREVRCIIAVAIGVTLEFAALAHSIPEAIRLESKVVELRKKIDARESEIERVRSDNIALAEKLDISIRKRTETEMALFPRIFEGGEVLKKGSILHKYAGTKFFLAVGNTRADQNKSADLENDNQGAETRNLARQIGGVLLNEKWVPSSGSNGWCDPGVTVIVHPGSSPVPVGFVSDSTPESLVALDAAKALVTELRNSQILVSFVMVHNGPPSDTVVILVGSKPTIWEINGYSGPDNGLFRDRSY